MSLCKCTAEPSRSSAYSCDLRWRIVYQHLGMGLSCRDVAKHFRSSRIVSRFDKTGSMDPTDRKGLKGVQQISKVLQLAHTMHKTTNSFRGQWI